MKFIFKYEINLKQPYPGGDIYELSLPCKAKILSVGSQKKNYIHVWAIIDMNQPDQEIRKIMVKGTGRELKQSSEDRHFLGTVFDAGFVWHIFEIA